MRIVDANVLLYAVNSSAEHHDASRRRLDGALSGADVVGLAWVSLPEDAMAQVRDWCSAPSAVMVNPTARHADVLSNLVLGMGSGGNLINDAHLAALAIEHRARIVTYDNDFGRFDGVSWDVPEVLLG